MSGPFRRTRPIRTYDIEHEIYQEYLTPLRNDFNFRCGYCNTPDLFFGGQKEFHIDHFKPKGNKKFPNFETLVNKYSNLVYSCPDCNRYKSKIWSESVPNWIDPEEEEYCSLFKKGNDGRISYVEENQNARFIFLKLRFFSKRKQLINLFDELDLKIQELKEINKKYSKTEVDELIKELNNYKDFAFTELRYHE